MVFYAPLQAAAIDQENEDYDKVAVRTPRIGISRRYLLLFFLCMMASLVFGVDLGWQLGSYYTAKEQQLYQSLGLLSDLGELKTTFQYERIYSEIPSNVSNAAWKEIFPARGGFFRHPHLTPDGAGLAVFHQLHCLDNIRRGYWLHADDRRRDSPHHITPAHIRHCIDYLRQSLMCHADTNIEPIDETLQGVRGFGVEHKCRDFDTVRDWVSKWEDGLVE
ncbi:hypothetical protein EYB26_002673 [Talaromyces marneffei]|uniref:uncharacterized protein n=1 Tax=Talaromyces marneffei TaxID=37727 RepID=UPI0012A7E7D5|nr:uncharacterized protein EYB26_002673 [Talaromyces marneffei]QGA15017.1 hypothetical protein EYB26_002673 [Talaromyces marneffei]